MIVVTGLLVTDLTCARIVLPNPGYFVSIRTTPPSATNTVVTPLTPPSVGLARPPVTMKRLSLTFSSRMSMGLCCAPTTAIVSAAIATRTPSVVHRLMASPPVAGRRNMDPERACWIIRRRQYRKGRDAPGISSVSAQQIRTRRGAVHRGEHGGHGGTDSNGYNGARSRYGEEGTMNSGWRRNSSLLGVVVVAAAATMTQAAVRAQDSSAAAGDRQVTFTRDVAPILQRSCQTCHRPGMMAPMSLLTYQEARPWARSIKAIVSNRDMPPWFIDKHVGIQKYKNDPSLSEAEIQTIVKWVDQGAPQGNAADMPPARNFGDLEAWHIQPTVIVKMPKPYMLKAHGPDEFIDVTIDPGFKEDMYVTAIETRPIHMSAYKVIHHATTNVIEDEDDPTGFFLNEYAIGKAADVFPPDSGRFIRAGSMINISLHMTAHA